MRRFFSTTLILLAVAAASLDALAQRQMETLGRGVVSIRQSATQVYVGWRMLGTDPLDIGFNVFRVTSGSTNLLNGSLITNRCDFVDTGALQSLAHTWFVQPVIGGVPQPLGSGFTMAANAPVQPYLSVPLQRPAGGIAADGVSFTYSPNDCSAGDLDGDGEYEVVVKWDPSNSKDNSQMGFTGKVFLDAYKLNGTRLWRIDLGPNIRAGAHYTQFMVYDLDGDGKAELACKTAPGTIDGTGGFVLMPGHDPNAVYTNSAGYILSGPEYFSIFNGMTGAALATTNYVPGRGNVNDWGDDYGNRVDRFLACVAYLDGVRPSVVMCRGYYTRAALAAWDWRNGKLTQRWLFDTGFSGGPWAAYKGQGAHSLTVGDVDSDGKDEIVYGACTIDDNGAGLYTTGLGNGDALHLSDMNPNRAGLEVWMAHEDPGSYGPNGLDLHDAGSGTVLFGVNGQNDDVGRGVALDIDPRFAGYEMWGSRGGLMNASGVQISSSRPGPINFASWWDTDLLRELLDGTTISKWDWSTSQSPSLLAPGGVASNNGSKATPCLSADILGDWREEVIWRSSANNELRIFMAATSMTNRIHTLMHDAQYRLAIAWQNVAYNQPPHPGFYIGPQMLPPPVPQISSAQLAWRGGNNGNAWDLTTTNWFLANVWTTNQPAIFSPGVSVLFDLRGAPSPMVNLVGSLTPGKVTVFAPQNHTFAGSGQLSGSMQLVKAGAGALTINTTNLYTGTTTLSGGALFVNGSLDASPVVVERRGTIDGPPRVGGAGRLGQGLMVGQGCGVIVGNGTNVAGSLVVSSFLIEAGGILNQFDLSSSPSGSNDMVQVFGNLTLNGTNTIQINQLNGFLGGGVYPLFRYSGTLAGGLTNLLLSGTFVQPVALTNRPGEIGLLAVVPSSPPAAPTSLVAVPVGPFQISLSWIRNSTNENNFLLERSTNNINFFQLASLSAGVTNYSDVGLNASTTYYYRVRAGNLAGYSDYSNTANATTPAIPPALIWRGDGSGNLWDIATSFNWFDGTSASVYVDGVDVVFDQSGSNNTPVTLSTILQPESVSVNATKSYTFAGSGPLAGGMALLKSGSGTLTINNSNSFTGGVTVNAGTVTLGNTSGAGSGQLRFNGGTVQMVVANQVTYANPLVILANSALNSAGGNNNIVSGPWSGSNTTLTISIASGGTFTVNGSMGNFTGTVSLGNSAGFFRFNSSGNSAFGSINTTYDLGMGSGTLNNRNGTTINLGALTGGPGTFLSGAGNSAGGASTYLIGAKNLSTTFAGRIVDATSVRTTAINKVGNATLTLIGSNAYSGLTTVSAGTLLVNGNQSAATNVVYVANGATLGGTGIIGGSTVVEGTLAAGTSIGQLTFQRSLILGPTAHCVFEIRKNPLNNDVVRVQENTDIGGDLTIVNVSVELLEAGDSFDLFEGGGLTGLFDEINLPNLEDGLAWDTSDLLTDGIIRVVGFAQPQFSAISATGSGLHLSGSGGPPNGQFVLLTSVNLALPIVQWSRLSTNAFDGSGNFNLTTPLSLSNNQLFFLIEVPSP